MDSIHFHSRKPVKGRRSAIEWFVAILLALVCIDPARAAVLTVTNLADAGFGTLRQAIAEAVSGDTVTFATTGTIGLTSTLVIDKSLTVQGPGSTALTITGLGADSVNAFITSNGLISMSGLTLSNAAQAVRNQSGGTLILSNLTILNSTPGASLTGALVNDRDCNLNLINCMVSSNRGGVRNLGNLTAANSTFVSNHSYAVYTSIAFTNPGWTSLETCTIAHNSGRGLVVIAAQLVLSNCTVTGNHAPFGGGGIFQGAVVDTQLVQTRNTIIAGNTSDDGVSPDCNGVISSLDYNLIGNTNGCSILHLTNRNVYGLDPRLGPLGYYGGVTPTLPLLAGSPAIDAGPSTGVPEVDQRGRPRPHGTAADIGAFESAPPYVIHGRITGYHLHHAIQVQANLTNATTTQLGNYSFEGLSSDAYWIAPADTNYFFAPTNRLVTVGPDQFGVDFTAYQWNTLSAFRLPSNSLQLVVMAGAGQTIELLGSTNLTDWVPISTNTMPPSNLLYLSEATTLPMRFYRTIMR